MKAIEILDHLNMYCGAELSKDIAEAKLELSEFILEFEQMKKVNNLLHSLMQSGEDRGFKKAKEELIPLGDNIIFIWNDDNSLEIRILCENKNIDIYKNYEAFLIETNKHKPS